MIYQIEAATVKSLLALTTCLIEPIIADSEDPQSSWLSDGCSPQRFVSSSSPSSRGIEGPSKFGFSYRIQLEIKHKQKTWVGIFKNLNGSYMYSWEGRNTWLQSKMWGIWITTVLPGTEATWNHPVCVTHGITWPAISALCSQNATRRRDW